MRFPKEDDSDNVLRVVGARVDYLKFGFRVELSTERLMLLAERSVRAKRSGACEVRIGREGDVGALCAQLKELRPGRWQLRSGAELVMVDEYAPSDSPVPGVKQAGWTLEIVYAGRWCQEHGWAETMRRAWAVAWEFGEVVEARFRRVDLCADIENWGELTAETRASLVLRSRCKLRCDRDGVPLEIDFEGFDHACDHTAAERVSGITISPGNELMARIYSKTREFVVKPDPEKEDTEKENWIRGGWTGGIVTRVEMQIRGAALQQLNARTFRLPMSWEEAPEFRIDRAVEAFGERLDAMWAYCVGVPGATMLSDRTERGWMRLIAPGFDPERKTRGAVDPRWELVRGVVFVAKRPPARRTYLRTFARSAQGTGCVLSTLGVHGMLTEIRKRVRLPDDLTQLDDSEYACEIREPDGDGVVPDLAGPEHANYESALVAPLERVEAEEILRQNMRAAYAAAADVAASDLIDQKGGAKPALEHFVTKWRAAWARNWQPAKCKRFPEKYAVEAHVVEGITLYTSEDVKRWEHEEALKRTQIELSLRVA